jgi:hypothetical protein
MVSYLPVHHLKINDLVIGSQDGMQLFMAKVLHFRFLENPVYINSPIANK